MDIFSGLMLGVVQGVTEFLPISSSGHLIIARDMLGLNTEYGLSFDIVLHFATSLAVLLYFRHDFFNLALCLVPQRIINSCFFEKTPSVEEPEERENTWCQREKTTVLALVLGTIPAVIAGLLLQDHIEVMFRSVELVAATLIIGSVVFYLAERFARHTESVTPLKGFAIGCFQVLALIPGMSRSGMTISGGLFFGLSRVEAARFSFLLAFPIVFGLGVMKLFELWGSGALFVLGAPLLAGALAAFAVGLAAIHYLLKYLKRHTLGIFIVYRIFLAIAVLMFV